MYIDKLHYLNLVLAVYRVTEVFPKGEPLRFQIREKANEILGGLFLINPEPSPLMEKKILKGLEVLDSYFSIAENQNWVDARNFSVLKKEYNKIKEEVLCSGCKRCGQGAGGGAGETGSRQTQVQSQALGASKELQPRPRKILEVLKERGKAQVGEFKEIFPEVTKRTLRRDFEFLLNLGLIKRIGDQRNTFYLIRT